MKKKPKKHSTYKNVVMFPGTADRLVSKGHEYVENNQYELANKCFEEALQFTEGDEMLLSIYAFSLYEVKSFERAKDICEKLLSIGPSMYIEVMELYLTVCMQLKQFKQVEQIIQSLLEEGAIPSDKIEKFERLKELNSNIASNADQKEDELHFENEINSNVFSIDNFLSISPNKQLNHIQELSTVNIRPIVPQLQQIIENENTQPFIKSIILILLVEQQVDIDIIIKKFDKTMNVNPTLLELPTKLPQFIEVSTIVSERLQREPSVLEMVEYLIAKHAIVGYPFEWLDFNAEDVALSYIDFVKTMFGEIQEMDYELIEFLQYLESLAELQEV